VTERDRLEKEFLRAQKMEAVGRLASGVAHDFNNLLAGVLGGLRVASEDLDAEHPARDVLDQVQQAVERGCSITRRLLDFSRLAKPKPGLVDPRQTLAAGERMIRRLIGEDVDVRVACDASVGRFFGDAGQLEQAILNLAINARDAMPNGGELEIRCDEVDLSNEDVARLGAALDPGPHSVLSVRDTGSGMDEEVRRRALEPFFTTKGPGLGTGLGLSSVASMVKQYHGHLELESEVGVGTTVRLYFPRASEAAAPEDLAVPAPCGGGETILIVEDEPLVLLGVQHVLHGLGYTVLAARDANAALAELEAKTEKIDLLLTDVVLPGRSGTDLGAAARKKHPGIRVLYMSAFPAEELEAQGRIAPGTLTLEKPFTDDEIAAKVRAALERPLPEPETGR
jgi:nitrogen-specific signal transduction histidine kinase